jgi:hypothetical protein
MRVELTMSCDRSGVAPQTSLPDGIHGEETAKAFVAYRPERVSATDNMQSRSGR